MRNNQLALLCVSSALSLAAMPAWGATLCVSATGVSGCATSIGAAVAAASAGDVINVGPGTYAESVVITKPLSLVGNGATINASGLMRGVFVNGSAAAGLNSVHVSGFTIKNANLEGILVLNASMVTLSGNTVTNNNQALVNGNCTQLPAYEPGEAQDCGEGIHLQAVDHSIVTSNTVVGNSGGTLLSDDTGATHDNLISFNTIQNNPYACGIVLASHPLAPTVAATTVQGVYHNTVYGNRSQNNGYSAGGGAGIGLFAAVPGAMTYGNVIVDNLVSGNGHPGISLHAHIPGQMLNDNMIVGNTVVGNGADTADAATAGPTGINIAAAGPVNGLIISGNSIQSESLDVVVRDPSPVEVNFNGLLGSGVGVANLAAGTIDATNNWWSCPAGPVLLNGCTTVQGAGVVATPWLQAPIPQQPSY